MALPFLQTPAAFTPLLDPPADAGAPLNFVFRGSQVLLHEATLGLPDDRGLRALGIAPSGCMRSAWNGPLLPGRLVRGRHRRAAGRPCAGTACAACSALSTTATCRRRPRQPDRRMGAHAPLLRLVCRRRWRACPASAATCPAPVATQAYPQICPAMMVLIRAATRCCWRKPREFADRRFTALAGFLEAGESVEEAVHREVYEEVGLRVASNLQYFGSQTWPFPNSLMIAFSAEYLSGEIRVDPAEIAEARWFGPGDEWPRDAARACRSPAPGGRATGVAHPVSAARRTFRVYCR
jgi:NAD+ diphosphatase